MIGKPLSPDEEAAFRLGDPSHKRAFLEEAALRILEACFQAKAQGPRGEGLASPEDAVEQAARLWRALEHELNK